MDFLDPKKKRAHRTRLFVGYGLMAVLLALATMILVFEVYGFDFDRKNGGIIQNGLILVDSHPDGAQVFLNDVDQGKSSARLVVPAGEYTLELRQQGYRSWRRVFTLGGSSIARMVYPVLFPVSLQGADVQVYDGIPPMSTESPDRRWLLVQRPGSLDTFDMIDTTEENPVAVPLVLPADTITKTSEGHKLEVVEWSTDNRHVLLRHSFRDGLEFIMLDREVSAESFNVNKLLGVAPTNVMLRDKRYDRLYIYDQNGGVIRLAETNTKTITPVMSGVIQFKPHGEDVLIYTTLDGAPTGKALLRVKDDDVNYTLKEISAEGKHFVDIARYDGDWYMVGGSSAEQRFFVYKDVFDAFKENSQAVPVPVTVLRLDATPEFLGFSATAQFIATHAGTKFAVYDAEKDTQYRYEVAEQLTPGQKTIWMDGHRLLVNSQNQIVVFDYDGSNLQRLMNSSLPHDIYFDRDYNRSFTIGPAVSTPDRSALVVTDLILNR